VGKHRHRMTMVGAVPRFDAAATHQIQNGMVLPKRTLQGPPAGRYET
jgi:hypothetical protein